MKKQISKLTILTVLSFLTLSSCVSNPANDAFTAEELAPQTAATAGVYKPNLAIEIASIEGQLMSVEAQITGAQARLISYQSQDSGINQRLISGAEAEITHYQMLKNNLIVRKQELSVQSALQ